MTTYTFTHNGETRDLNPGEGIEGRLDRGGGRRLA